MPRFPDHLTGQGPDNPFPGIKVLERRIGREIPHRLGSNEGLDMPHRALRERFGDALAEHVYCYGDSEALGVRQRLQTLHGLALEHTLVDAGADSLMALALRALTVAGDRVISAGGTYPTFGYFAQGHGCQLVEPPYHEAPGVLAPDLERLLSAAIKEDARLVYLANPDNPSGHLHDDDAIRRLREALPDDCWLLLDEAYHDFRDDADSPFSREVLPGVVRLRTLSKAHGLAGLRIGYAIAEPETLAVMMKVRIHYAVSTLTQAAAETVLDHNDEVVRHIGDVKARRDRLADYFRGLGTEVLPSATNFIALRLADADLAGRLNRELLEAGRLIARPAHPDLGHILRITAVEDALQPGRFEILERALGQG
ncbi:aminotransferase class I/II-fold pyridoxal phosphate-dependent enzyme [Halomonas campisalis]|uniref:histidinol-phosphate transaminase n=1 Tax=Billgrantia campisalis TaxID=74661 RepID=A0ABS9P747_9GAMM|nr:aminotransferase class I/II-fold pyridoxal phosphate-dependent enzyme [Halomonas campisalis]MCG6657239.1 aminotransferase class I/II-fold pyridoxal phosphate-dependent enzyme [Halomonas campisalis]MDR5862424.1 aminotransferase class I/II-fold pyridoxal phosphate-dependent enzyme [Halomonas campisalis]